MILRSLLLVLLVIGSDLLPNSAHANDYDIVILNDRVIGPETGLAVGVLAVLANGVSAIRKDELILEVAPSRPMRHSQLK